MPAPRRIGTSCRPMFGFKGTGSSPAGSLQRGLWPHDNSIIAAGARCSSSSVRSRQDLAPTHPAVHALASLQEVQDDQDRQIEHATSEHVAHGDVGAAAAVTALTPVASSGSDVTVASRMMPIQLPERPVLSAIMSPLRDSFGLPNPTNARHRPNANQICVADIPLNMTADDERRYGNSGKRIGG